MWEKVLSRISYKENHFEKGAQKQPKYVLNFTHTKRNFSSWCVQKYNIEYCLSYIYYIVLDSERNFDKNSFSLRFSVPKEFLDQRNNFEFLCLQGFTRIFGPNDCLFICSGMSEFIMWDFYYVFLVNSLKTPKKLLEIHQKIVKIERKIPN